MCVFLLPVKGVNKFNIYLYSLVSNGKTANRKKTDKRHPYWLRPELTGFSNPPVAADSVEQNEFKTRKQSGWLILQNKEANHLVGFLQTDRWAADKFNFVPWKEIQHESQQMALVQ